MSNDSNLVSIVIPIYNVEKYISKCLDSVLSQTYDNLEIICIDDGSTDDSASIVSNYIERDSRIRLYRKKNGGLSSARNFGIEKSNGSLLFFLDSDDWLETSGVSALVCEYERNNRQYRIISGGIRKYDEDSSTYSSYSYFRKLGVNTTTPEKFFQSEVVAWNKLYHRSLFFENNIRFLDGVIHEDEEFYWKVFLTENRVVSIPENVINYRVRAGSIVTSSKPIDYYKNHLSVVDSIHDYLLICNLFDSYKFTFKSLVLKFYNALKKFGQEESFKEYILFKYGDVFIRNDFVCKTNFNPTIKSKIVVQLKKIIYPFYSIYFKAMKR